jgi:hypothetical protein
MAHIGAWVAGINTDIYSSYKAVAAHANRRAEKLTAGRLVRAAAFFLRRDIPS